MQAFRHELLTNLVFLFLSNHPNSAIVLQAAWNVQVQLRAALFFSLQNTKLAGHFVMKKLSVLSKN